MSAPDHRLVGSNALDPVAAQTRARAAFGAMAASPAARRKARAAVYALVGALVVLGYGARDERRAGVRARALDSRPSSHRAFPGGRPAPRRPEASPSSASPPTNLFSLTNRGSPPRAPFSQRTPLTSPPPGAEARGTISRRGPSPRTSRARVVPAETTSSSRAPPARTTTAPSPSPWRLPRRPRTSRTPSAARSTPPAPTMTPTSLVARTRRAPAAAAAPTSSRAAARRVGSRSRSAARRRRR